MRWVPSTTETHTVPPPRPALPPGTSFPPRLSLLFSPPPPYLPPKGALLVYDITDNSSFIKVKNWVKELRNQLGKGVTLAIIGNKVDLEKNRAVNKEEAIRCLATSSSGLFVAFFLSLTHRGNPSFKLCAERGSTAL